MSATTTYTTEDIRNVALVGPAGSGKTTLTEALLYRAGAIGKMGSVEAGGCVSDFTDEEHEHGHSLTDALVHFDHANKHINLLDTPGYPDFLGQALSALPAVEMMALVLNAEAGIEPVARRLMDYANQRDICRMIVVNRMDANHADLPGLIEQIQATFGKACLPINLPAGDRSRVVDCFFNLGGESDFDSVEQAHTAIVDQVVEVNDDLAAAYLEGEQLSPEQLHEAFEAALRQGHLIPICFTAGSPHVQASAGRQGQGDAEPIGVDELLDLLIKLGPNPSEGNPRPFVRGQDLDHEIHAEPDPDKHVLAHVFNIRVDPFVGKLATFRLHQGTIRSDSQLYVDSLSGGVSKKPIRVGHLFKIQGKDHIEIDHAIAGDLAAVAKVDEVHRDTVLHDSHEEDHIHLRPLPMPEPMSSLAITATKRGDEQKIADALAKLTEEDPSFTVTRHGSTGETVIHGLGELHLRVMLEKLARQFRLEVNTSPPKIAYRETITAGAEGHHRHKKQSGGAGQFGEVYLRIEPMDRGEGFEFVNETVGGSIPSQFMSSVEKGVREGLESGCVAGYEMQDVRVRVYDGKHHPVDSKEVAFVTAGKRAFLDAAAKAGPVLLEPMVEMQVAVANAHLGDVTGDLSSKRGRIQGTDMLGNDQSMIHVFVPLSEVTHFPSQLKSMTGGQGSFTQTFAGYEPMPQHVQQRLMQTHSQVAVNA